MPGKRENQFSIIFSVKCNLINTSILTAHWFGVAVDFHGDHAYRGGFGAQTDLAFIPGMLERLVRWIWPAGFVWGNYSHLGHNR